MWWFPGESTLRGKAPHRILDRGPISNPTLAPLLSQKCGRFYGSKRRSAQLNWRCVRSWETGTRHWEGIMKIRRMAQVALSPYCCSWVLQGHASLKPAQ